MGPALPAMHGRPMPGQLRGGDYGGPPARLLHGHRLAQVHREGTRERRQDAQPTFGNIPRQGPGSIGD